MRDRRARWHGVSTPSWGEGLCLCLCSSESVRRLQVIRQKRAVFDDHFTVEIGGAVLHGQVHVALGVVVAAKF